MKQAPPTEVAVTQLQTSVAEACILGVTPLIFNRLSEQARRDLLLPPKRKTIAERASSLKSDPVSEYRASVYRTDDPAAETLLTFPAPAFKGAMAAAALDIPGAARAQINRLCRVLGYAVPIYGTPRIFLAAVRDAGMTRAPRIRTRAILPEWACRLTISYATPVITGEAIANLLNGAGTIIGVGDFRQEKGRGDFGLFEIVPPDNPDFVRITTEQRRAEQEAALRAPEAFDHESRELLAWFEAEAVRRDLKKATA